MAHPWIADPDGLTGPGPGGTIGVSEHHPGDVLCVAQPEDAMSAIGIALLIFAHAADYLTFVAMVRIHGLQAEYNPFVVALAHYGILPLTLAKVSAVLLLASTFLVVGRTRPRLAGGVLLVGILLGGLGTLSNLGSL